MTRFDGCIVSFQVSTDDFAGSHDARQVAGYTWDLAKAQLVTLADVVSSGANWKKNLIPYCQKSLHDQFEEAKRRTWIRLRSRPRFRTLAAGMGKNKATIAFWVASMGGMPGGEFDVGVPTRC